MSRWNLECPYCEEKMDTPDVEEGMVGSMNEHQCSKCEKYFIFEIEVELYFQSKKADCLNGSPHNYKKVHEYPDRLILECYGCGEYKNEKKLTEVQPEGRG